MDAEDTARRAPAVGGAFQLIDHHGHAVSDRTYLGHRALILFGFTHCRVVCPRNLRRLSLALEATRPAADDLVALYVTVDPERDDPQTMRTFLHAYPRFTGLTGSRLQIDAMLAAYRVYARRRAEVEGEGDYAVAHSSLAYLLDADGACRTHFPLVLDDAELVDRLHTHLGRSPSFGGTITD